MFVCVTGQYAEAIETSRLAVDADAKYIAAVADPGFYTTACAHDWHLMMYAAMLQGSATAADAAVVGMRRLLPLERLDVDIPHLRSTLEAYSSMAMHVDVRFGRWQAIAAAPLIDDLTLQPVTTARMPTTEHFIYLLRWRRFFLRNRMTPELFYFEV